MNRLQKLDQSQPLIMGILNMTPDSFSDGGLYTDLDQAYAHALRMIKEGADIIDIGGESTRPGSDPIGATEQIARVLPIIERLRQGFEDCLISIDTTLPEVAAAALDAGCDLINDVSSGFSPDMFSLAAKRAVPIILMHMQGTPKTMQDDPYYQDVVAEVSDYLLARAGLAESQGVLKKNIILDPGIGFGKRKIDNLKLLAHLNRLTELGYPLLLGTSRKRFMGSLCHETRVAATVATTALGVAAGVKIFRVHDVKENRQGADVAYAIRLAGQS